MSVGHLCEHCRQGRVRPFQFSREQAIITCDNVDCESRLEVSPWDCVINRPLKAIKKHSANQERLHLWSRSSSSSGIQSDFRSPIISPSPSPSCESVTDKEVENLLRRSLGQRPVAKDYVEKNHRFPECPQVTVGSEQLPVVSQVTVGSEQLSAESQVTLGNEQLLAVHGSDSFATFFELLNNLDLDIPSQQSVKKECTPLTQVNGEVVKRKFTPLSSVNGDEGGLETVTSELESWMKSFEVPLNAIKEELYFDSLEARQGLQHTDSSEKVENLSLVRDRHYIPSKGSAFSQVSPKKEYAQNIRSSSVVGDISDNVVERHCYHKIAPAFEKPDDAARNDLSICDAQFLSPATSAVSDDSGYEDNSIKLNLVPPPPPPHLKPELDFAQAFSVVVRNKDDGKRSQTSFKSLGVLKDSMDMKVTTPQAQEVNNLPSVFSPAVGVFPSSNAMTCKADEMEVEEGHPCSPEPINNSGSSHQICSIVSNEMVSNEGCSHKSSQLSDPSVFPSPLTIHHTSETKVSNDETLASNNCRDTSDNDNIGCNVDNAMGVIKPTNIVEEQITTTKRGPGRPRGPWIKQTTNIVSKRNKRVAKHKIMKTEDDDFKVASLRKGLNKLLQAPSLQFKREENRSQNLTNLGLRSRLNVRYSFSL